MRTRLRWIDSGRHDSDPERDTRCPDGKIAADDSPLRHAPHTCEDVTSDDWDRDYSRKQAAFPIEQPPGNVKYWPSVGRIDNVYGDRNLVCSCPPLEDYEEVA